jgi:HTH-type transcriptional regulator/antitoxin HigA
MDSLNNRNEEVDKLLNDLFDPFGNREHSLAELFEARLRELDISERSARDLMEVEYRPLKAVLEGNKNTIDFLILKKLALFLGISEREVTILFLKSLDDHFKEDVDAIKVRDFIRDNFDLASLKNSGFIDSLTDYKEIENRIVEYFGYSSIFEYGKGAIDVAYSKGKPKSKNVLTKKFFIESCAKTLSKINNYYEYDRALLIEYFPNIRWHSLNEKNGLYQVVRDLFKLGVTVIFEPYVSTLYIRGATLAINHKPCIVLTNYTDNYPSLWFALVHELHHVLFDWEEIYADSYQLSGLDDLFSPSEVESDNFAREYLFPKEKLKIIEPYINNPDYVAEYAKANFVHPSIPYSFYCFDKAGTDKKVWARYKKYIPSLNEAVASLEPIPWQRRKGIKEIAKQKQERVFNNL